MHVYFEMGVWARVARLVLFWRSPGAVVLAGAQAVRAGCEGRWGLAARMNVRTFGGMGSRLVRRAWEIALSMSWTAYETLAWRQRGGGKYIRGIWGA